MSSPVTIDDFEMDRLVGMGDSDIEESEGPPLSGGGVQQHEMSHDDTRDDTASMAPTSKDFVLVWEEEEDANVTTPDDAKSMKKTAKRKVFEENLKNDGLLLSSEKCKVPRPSKLLQSKAEPESRVLHFVHIHVPQDVLREYASVMKLRMPVKTSLLPVIKKNKKRSEDYVQRLRNMLFNRFFHCIDDESVKKEKEDTQHKLMTEFSKEKIDMFDVEAEDFFPQSVRIMVADFLLEQTSYSTSNGAERGIRRLIEDKTYLAAYPLHDDDGLAAEGKGSKRAYLLNEWASVRKWCMYQPIDSVNEYLGVKNGLYFAWLGYYTYMLVPAAVVGLACFLYGVATLSSYTVSQDVCERGGNTMMCPTCDKVCDYEKLSDWCFYARAIYLFDNPASIFFAFFMTVWSTVYIDMWKRYSAGILHRWGQSAFDNRAESPRPEYLASLSKIEKKKKKKRKDEDPLVGNAVSFWQVRVPFTVFSYSVVLAMIAVVVTAVLGVLVYEMVVVVLFAWLDISSSFMTLFTAVSGSIIQLVCIKILSKGYNPLAVKLTDIEYLRTQSLYDNSLALKRFLFEFVNTYAPIFYVAFFKGKFPGYPAKYNRIFGLRQLECSHSGGGCLLELSIQVIVILVGDQTVRLVWFAVMLAVDKWKKQRQKAVNDEEIANGAHQLEDKRWCKDFQLRQWNATGLVDEYLEMVIQYGLVTIFVAAFPLAPLFALINNVFELRLDAKKFLLVYRRSVPSRVKNIGVWLYVMEVLGRVAIITNAVIIAFSSSFIPKLIYKMAVAEGNQQDVGYLEFSLAKFNTSDIQQNAMPMRPSVNVSICRYPEFRNPPDHPAKYKRPSIYWNILVGRLIFIVLFQNVISLISLAIQYLIPDTPASLREQMSKEADLVNEAIISEMRKKRQAILRQK